MYKKDRFNEMILQELKINARISNAELAEKIGLSPSACLRRVQELENTGVIKGYRAIIDNEMLGNTFSAYVAIGLGEHDIHSQRAFEQAIKSADEVVECHNITGSLEYFLRVETKSIKAYKTFHANVLGEIPQVNTIITHVLMGSPKDERG